MKSDSNTSPFGSTGSTSMTNSATTLATPAKSSQMI